MDLFDDTFENELDPDIEMEMTEASMHTWLARLDDTDPETRVTAIQNLWNHVDAEVMERLYDLAQNDPDQTVRGKALSGLGRYIYEAVILDFEWDDPYLDDWYTEQDYQRIYTLLTGVYTDESKSLEERRYAVEGLSFLYDDPIPGFIEELYVRPEKEAKISALFAMGRNGSKRWLDILGREIWSRDKEIRIEAIDAVAEMNADSFGKDLWRMTYDHDQDVVMAAIWALGQTGWEEAFERLDELTLHPDPDISQLADVALEEWMMFSQLSDDAGLLAEDEDLNDETEWSL
ncbi:MAG: HEAT repeat domain-containing protein [Anaerolineae bacterium]|nr:HEAT repeat domain-containing protein [Anaerolineae bacterium]